MRVEWIDWSRWQEYKPDLEFTQLLIQDYKDLLWLVLSIISSLIVIYGIVLPQKNAQKSKLTETTLSLIDRWTAHGMPKALLQYQEQYLTQSNSSGNEGANAPLQSDAKTQLCSFFHTVALFIREKKVNEALIRKSQIAIAFVLFFETLEAEDPLSVDKHSFYGREFRPLYQRWKKLSSKQLTPYPHALSLNSTTARSSQVGKKHLRLLR